MRSKHSIFQAEQFIFLMIHFVILGIFLGHVRESWFASSGRLIVNQGATALLVDTVTLVPILAAFIFGMLRRGNSHVLYALSLSALTLNIFLTFTPYPETMIMLDVLVLMGLSLLFSLFVSPLIGASHGLVSALLSGLHMLRYSSDMAWVSAHILTLLGVYVSLVLVVSYYAHRHNMMIRHQSTGASDSQSHRFRAVNENQLMFRMIHPLFMKSGNAQSTIDNMGHIISELRDGQLIVGAQRTLLEEQYRLVSQDMDQIHQGFRVLSTIKSLYEKSANRNTIVIKEFYLSQLNLHAHSVSLGASIEARFLGLEQIRINRDVLSSLLSSLFEYARFSGDIDGDRRIQLTFSVEPTRCTVEYLPLGQEQRNAAGLVRSNIQSAALLERNTELLFLEFISSAVLGGDMEFGGFDDFAFRLDLPIR